MEKFSVIGRRNIDYDAGHVLQMFSIAILTLFCILLLTNVKSFAQDEFKNRTYRVAIDISADPSIESYVETYIKKHLRKFSDVTIADNDPDWKLSIVAMSNQLRDGSAIGYTTSAIALKTYDIKAFLSLNLDLRKRLLSISCPINTFERKCKYAIDTIFSVNDTLFKNAPPTYRYGGHWLQTGSDLEKQCESVVMNFNSDCLEGDRETDQMMSEMIEKMQNTIRNVKSTFEKQSDSTKK